MRFARVGAALRAFSLDRRIRAARRREARALIQTGEAVAASAYGRSYEALRILIDRIAEDRRRSEALETAVAASLASDRADYAAVAGWARPLVIARGLFARAVLRHQGARLRHAIAAAHATLGAAALESPGRPAVVPPLLGDAVATARGDVQAAVAEREILLAPFGGTALPPACHRMAREGIAFGHALWQQVRPLFLPRAPALAGFAAGWWVAATFTDSRWHAVLRSVGLEQGGAYVVSADTYRATAFWLPIVSAALCAYLGARAAATVRRRYGQPASDGAGPTPAGRPPLEARG